MPSICVASHHARIADLLADGEFADIARLSGMLIELRLDQYEDLSLKTLRAAVNRFGAAKLVVTYRCAEEGGARESTDEVRLPYMLSAVDLSAAFLDVELRTLQRNALLRDKILAPRKTSARTQLVVSFHDFGGVPHIDRLRAIRQEAEAIGADVVKVAVKPDSCLDGAPLLEMMWEGGDWQRPFLALAMGEAGLWSRVLGPIFPNAGPFTFGRGEGSPGTAPGQPTWRELYERYRFLEIESDWPVYGVMGDSVSDVAETAVLNHELRDARMKGVTIPFKIEGDPLHFLKAFVPLLGLRGIATVCPHVEKAREICTEVNPAATVSGVIDTLVPDDVVSGAVSWTGHASHAIAAASCLAAALGDGSALIGADVLLLGAGIRARSIAAELHARGAMVLVHNRTEARAAKLAHDLGVQSVNKDECIARLHEFQAVVNCTPLGSAPLENASPLGKNEIPKGSVVCDTVYNPVHTKLLRLAEESGCRTVSGQTILMAQCRAQLERFMGRPLPTRSVP